MSSTVFSISLNELDMAKLGELQNKFPTKSRNGMIRHIIHLVHSGEFNKMTEMQQYYEGVINSMAKIYNKDVKK